MTLYPPQDTFVRGEVSPRLHARASLDLYKAALARCENFVTLPHGGLRKRGGTFFVGEVPSSARKTRLIPFVFSDDQAYALVLGHLVMRIYAYGARVGSVELVTPWTEDDIFEVKFVQSADDMWLTHQWSQPRKLTRTDHTTWAINAVDYSDGPFRAVNTNESLTLYASAGTGSVTLTASSALFTAGMVGRLVRIDMESYELIEPWEPNTVIPYPTIGARRRFEGRVYESVTTYTGTPPALQAKTGATPPTHTKGIEWDGPYHYEYLPDIPVSGGPNLPNPDFEHGLQWEYLHSGFGVARITAFTDSTHVTATVLSTFPDEVVGSGNASFVWRFGVFDDGEFPRATAIFEERLVYSERFSVYGSATGDFDDFEVGEKGDDALVFRNAGGGAANDILWLEDIDGFLAIGTIGGIRSLSGSGIDEALTPSSFKNRPSRCAPCANVQPVQVGKAYAYVQKGRKKLAELTLGQQLRFESDDLGQISEHIPKRGVVELAFQSSPDPFLWFPLETTGELGGFTYQPSQDVRGMHRHLLGGSFPPFTECGIVESVCVTPGQTGEDDVWLIVKRKILGATKRYIEILTPAFEYGAITDAFQVDSGLSRTGSAVGSVSGAGHLNGETVDVLADGVVYRGLRVAGGIVTLPDNATAATWHVGLPFESGADTLELDVGGRDGSLRGRKKRVVSVILSLFETDLSGLEIASLIKNRWEPVRLPSVATPGTAATLFTGNLTVPVDDSWEGQGRITIRHTNPTPCTIRALTPAFDNEP